jgi:hypothetical protein
MEGRMRLIELTTTESEDGRRIVRVVGELPILRRVANKEDGYPSNSKLTCPPPGTAHCFAQKS